MAKRLLITGGGGFVAGSVIRHAAARWEVHATTRSAPPSGVPGTCWHRLDLGHAADLSRLFEQTRPHAVIHAAALADIDRCENNPELARAINIEVTRQVASHCAGQGARLVLLSTDTVFDGRQGGYTEADDPSPINAYARTKVAAEQLVLQESRESLVARLSLVVGLPLLGTGNSFLARMTEAWGAGREVGVPASETRTPLDVVTAGRALVELAGADVSGVLHLAGNDRLNRFELARRMARHLGFREELVVLREPEGSPDRAPRPRDVSLRNDRARSLLTTPLIGLSDALDLIREAQAASFP